MTGRSVPPDGQAAATTDRLVREIKRRRIDAGLSQRALAGRIGYSRQYVSMAEWTDGNLPSVELVSAIDTALQADGHLILLRRQAASERRSQRNRPVGGASSTDRGVVATKRRDMLRACGIGAISSVGLQDLVVSAARDSARLSALLNRPSVESGTIDDAAADLRRVATEYVLAPDLRSVLVDLLSIREILAAQINFAADVLAELGATFTFSLARQHYYSSMAYAELGEWSKVMGQVGATRELYSRGRSHAWPATVTIAETNSARAVLHLEGPEAALQELRSVFEIPGEQRIPQVLAGLGRVQADLDRVCFGSTKASEEIYQSIREFESVSAGHC